MGRKKKKKETREKEHTLVIVLTRFQHMAGGKKGKTASCERLPTLLHLHFINKKKRKGERTAYTHHACRTLSLSDLTSKTTAKEP